MRKQNEISRVKLNIHKKTIVQLNYEIKMERCGLN